MQLTTFRPVLMGTLIALTAVATRAESQTKRTVRYTKSSYGTNISRSVLTVADTASHTLVQSFRIDVGQSDSPDFIVVQERVWLQGEVRGTTKHFAGYTTFVMQGGEEVFLRWIADATPHGSRADGEPAIESGTAIILGGTGRYSAIRGRGVYRGYGKGPVVEENLFEVEY